MARRKSKSDRVLDEVNQRLLDYYLEIDKDGSFTHPPSNDEELYEFIEIAFGITLPTKVIEPGHSSPFQFVADCFFERVKNALAFASRNGGKALALDTPILTPSGWSQMGDLEVGSLVFAPDGTETRVTDTSQVFKDHRCFSLKFSTGEEIVADEEHRWVVQESKSREDLILTTRELFEGVRDPGIRYQVVRARPIEFKPTAFYLPYVLEVRAEEASRSGAYHQFLSIKEVESVPTKCIAVAHESHCFLAGRSLIKTHNTQSVAVLNMLDMLFKEGCEIASLGAVKNQAKKAYSYFTEFTTQDWFLKFAANYVAVTGRDFLQKEIQEETSFGNGSKQEILVATEKGLRSPHPHKARIDEVDEIAWSVLQTGLSMSRSEGDIRGQNIFTSTRQHASGSMQALLDKAAKTGAIKVYQWNIWESVKKCERRCFDDPVHGTCPIYAYCGGKAHRCDGFYEIEDFIDKVGLIDRDKFETEWENKKPSREKLVYPKFDDQRHVMTPEKLAKITGRSRVPPTWNRTCGIDFGASPGHPFVYAKLAQIPNTGAWILFFEYVAEQKLMRDHATAIKVSPYWTPSDPNFADTAGKQERMELRAKGIRTKDAVKEVQMGIDFIRSLLAGFPPLFEPMLYVWHECTFAIDEFNAYSWPTRPDGKPDKSGRPLQMDDHVLDSIRYALYSRQHKKHRGTRMRRANI